MLTEKCRNCERYSITCGGSHIMDVDTTTPDDVTPIEMPKQLQDAIDEALKTAAHNQLAFKITRGEWIVEYKSEFYKKNVKPFRKEGC